jgi:hypothetical protein
VLDEGSDTRGALFCTNPSILRDQARACGLRAPIRSRCPEVLPFQVDSRGRAQRIVLLMSGAGREKFVRRRTRRVARSAGFLMRKNTPILLTNGRSLM